MNSPTEMARLYVDVGSQKAKLPVVKMFVLAIFAGMFIALGGFGSIPGAFAAAILIGLVESFTGFYVAAVLKYVAVFAIYLVVILVRPKGLFGW